LRKVALSWVIATNMAVLGFTAAAAPAAAAGTVAPGCTSDRPTSIGGAIYGYGGQFNNWTINAMVGIDLTDANGVKVNPDGSRYTGKSYPALDYVNPNLAQPGEASGGERTWGRSGGDGPLCLSSNVKTVWLETYPKSTDGTTDKTYFGGDQFHGWSVTPGAANSYSLRLPTNDAHGGNTGGVNGYITQGGHKVNVGTTAGTKKVTIRAWSNQGSCGVFGFSAAADAFGPSGSLDADYYRMDNLAGGQCGAASEAYRLIVSICTLTAPPTGALVCQLDAPAQTKTIAIADGRILGAVNFSF
jgi:hypothetical protein